MKFNLNNYKGNYAMHCVTEEEAREFCNYLHRIGREWNNEDSYIQTTEYHIYHDVVLRRNGHVEIVNRDMEMFIAKDSWMNFDTLSDDLREIDDSEWNIIAVRRPEQKYHCQFSAFENQLGTLVYERKEPEEMTLEQVCKLLGKEIKIIP